MRLESSYPQKAKGAITFDAPFAVVTVSSDYVYIALRVRHAQKLLDTTDFSVPEIAQQAGFGSAKYFREQFRRQTGLSPQGYRDQRHVL